MRLPRLNLTSWILVGFILGILTGLFFGDLTSVMRPASDAFIKIWQITILPSVALSLIVGIGSLKRDTAKQIAVKAILVLLLIWAICIIGYFSFQLAFPPRVQASFFSTQFLTPVTDVNLLDLFIPSNPFLSLSDGIIPATVLFCLFLGFALMLDDGSGPIVSILRTLLRALERMTHIISLTFPVGIFVITAVTAGTLTFENFLDLQVFIVTLAVAAVLLGLIAMPLLVTCFTTFRYRDILAASSRAMLLAFSTGTEFITLPLISEGVEKLFQGRAGETGNGNIDDEAGDRDRGTLGGTGTSSAGDPKGVPAPGKDPGDVRSLSEIMVPVAYTFPLLGGFVPFLFILFVSWMYKDPLGFIGELKLIAIGIPSFFGSSKASVISLLNLMHLPADANNLYVSSGILRQAFVAPLSVISIFSLSTITIALSTNRARFRWKRAVMCLIGVVLLAAIAIAGLHAGFTYLLAGTYHGSDKISQIELPLDPAGNRLDSVINTTVYLNREDVPPVAPPPSVGRDEIREIRDRGVLRVGYNSNNVPFVFFNGKGELVGYDVEMAYDLARTLNVSRIAFVPITGTNLAESLDSGYCDIAMSAVVVTPDRLDQMKFTDPTVTVHLAFVVPDGNKDTYTQLDDVQKMDGLRVAVYNNTALVGVAHQLLPRATIVPIDTKEDFFVGGKADVLLIPAEEGYTLTLQYPLFDVAIIQPSDSYQMMYAYPVAKESSDSYLLALDYWLRTEKDYGMLDAKYNYWVLGEIPSVTEPRWSVIRNELHWVT
ncbi:cation:dicarboxylate symporter family transporter [Methanoregula sp.]|uniref:cation:dicarboxylate symporter family transporter n=1 Tax=Methanoregula sp. TaxID=2052170 RepID=UPI002B78025C|nr:cation:dicarboxylase symporter family transporter [Methanoregula sp.]HVP97601.1 cation:dicarboxylase symporter family transporter [Methanoregula sp.]